MQLLYLRDHPEWTERAAQWYHEKWGVPLDAYRESILACQAKAGSVPQWYLALDEKGEIIGGLGAIENDFHKRPDLTPNVCAVYVEPPHRMQGVARAMLDCVCRDLAEMGVHTAYLLTDHTNFYEKCGWSFLCRVEENGGGTARVYKKEKV